MVELAATQGETGLPCDAKVVGVYVRNSTRAQIGNPRSEWQMDLVPYVEGMGYAVRVYQEWGVSGTTLAQRPKANSMLGDLQAGRIQGIAVESCPALRAMCEASTQLSLRTS